MNLQSFAPVVSSVLDTLKLKAFVPIIKSMLDMDLYKLTMLQAMLHAFPANQATYSFFCRNEPATPLALLKDQVEAQLDHLCTLRFTQEDLAYLGTLPYLKSDFLDFLRIFQFQREFITVVADGDKLRIDATGPQIHVMLFEIFVLSIVNELYFRQFDQEAAVAEARVRLAAKIALIKEAVSTHKRRHPYEVFDFGGRRRFSGELHDEVVGTFVREIPDVFKGTSNLYLARKYGIAAIGTMAHEYLQTFQAVGIQLKLFQKAALEAWVQEYRGDLGIALTDVVGMDAFLADFDLYFAKLFDGMRHDSGEPIPWGEKALARYAQLRIDPHTKRLVFSDGLTVPSSLELWLHFGDRIGNGFGIGTNFTNDTGIPPLNIVMKLMTCNGQPVAKLPDSEGKTLCQDQTFLAYMRQVFNRN
jgi:nicotinate phosphoribosyltransferase